MRFGLLVAVVACGGAVAGFAIPALYPKETDATERVAGGAATKVFFDPSELNPIRWVFDFVKTQVETNANKDSFPVGKPVTISSFQTLQPSDLHFDNDLPPGASTTLRQPNFPQRNSSFGTLPRQ